MSGSSSSVSMEQEMHATNGNGDDKLGHTSKNSYSNGRPPPPSSVTLDRTDREIVRLIGQHLKIVGLERSAEVLMEESGCCLEHLSAIKFRKHVLSGDWAKADHDLQELPMTSDGKQQNCNAVRRFQKQHCLEAKSPEWLQPRPAISLAISLSESLNQFGFR